MSAPAGQPAAVYLRSSLSLRLAALRLVLLLVVALCLPETRVWGFAATSQPASGVFESASLSSIGEFTIGIGYYASDCSVAARGADNVADGLRLRNQLAGQEIAGGHAFTKHASEFGFKSRAEMARHVENVMTNPSATRNLSRGRTAYWDDASQSVVIRNPSAADGGTVFRPTNGRAYFDNLQ